MEQQLREFLKRARIALSIIVGFVVGKLLVQAMGHHTSEFFIGGFMLGVIATHALYAVIERLGGNNDQ